MAIRFLYPCYFDADLTRSEGRRVAKSQAVSSPNMAMVSRAAKLCAIPVLNEERDAHHPAQWYKAGGRVRVEFTGSKENLLKMVVGKIGGR
ncbi:MAG: signal recognition particle subunit SRP19/SEC65 family protein [Methanocorpusculum sp.]|jgi:signal recognition particle subunit SRP19|nr:signal recognition particle subunit SRP19/SEC65 family protein [Methanocorpusculum sp.]MDD3257680.1 signal recognition particle subunit SRP19/SEC65 family protein [Methanocorpusculum sp.]MDD4132637.1 signal recognition particle subunit SRP19/SEC65 family protein [Methanocorpusculum sp.]